MAQFDFYKFVTENRATVASKLNAGKKALIKESIEASDAEREQVLDIVQNNYGIKDAVQEFLGWDEEDAENADGTNWDDVVDAIMEDPKLKAEVLGLSEKRITEEEDEFDTPEEKEPTKKDISAVDKELGSDSDKRTQLAKLTKQKDELIQKLKAGEITIDQYKQMIGTIPQQIKTLTADLAKLTDVSDEEGEESLEEGDDVAEAVPSHLMYSNVIRPGDAASFFEKYDDTDLAGPGVEMAIDELIEDIKGLIQKQIPSHDQNAARIAVKKLWKEKIDAWKSN